MENIRREDWESLKPTVLGWGVVDVNYTVVKTEEFPKISGKRNRKVVSICPYYVDWASIIQRCKSYNFQEKWHTYKDCTVDPEWKYLSNFIKWVDSQPNRNWVNCIPDKDLLIVGNKHYSPDTVVYIPKQLNGFILDSCSARGDFMLGVNLADSIKNPYQSRCNNPFTRKREYLGIFPTELEAHKAWQAKKHEYACLLADTQEEPTIIKALQERYAPDKDWRSR